MAKEAVFTMKLEPELRDAFMAAAAVSDRPASQVVREFMRDYVRQDRERREYEEFYRRKVEKGREQLRSGLGRSDEDVRAEFASRVKAFRKAGRKTA